MSEAKTELALKIAGTYFVMSVLISFGVGLLMSGGVRSSFQRDEDGFRKILTGFDAFSEIFGSTLLFFIGLGLLGLILILFLESIYKSYRKVQKEGKS